MDRVIDIVEHTMAYHQPAITPRNFFPYAVQRFFIEEGEFHGHDGTSDHTNNSFSISRGVIVARSEVYVSS